MHITKADVGRKVIHRDGSESTITKWDGDNWPVVTSHIDIYFKANGQANNGNCCHRYDIIAFADEKERKMKHIIAGEAQEDVLEWKINIGTSGQLFLIARRGGGAWKEVVRVSTEGDIDLQYNKHHRELGLKVAE